jgi:regulatory protein
LLKSLKSLTPPEPLSSQSLRARAIAALARREYSRQELERKLSPLAQSPDQLNDVLGELQREGLLSDTRFAESVARVKGSRFGSARVRYELQQKGVPDTVAHTVLRDLAETESARIRRVWEKRFGVAPTSAEEAARQQRFLMQRGFSSDDIGRLMRDLRGR